jgi:hypothetical protein
VEYYRTDEGKLKKKIQNGKRGKPEAKAGLADVTQCDNAGLAPDEHRFAAGMVSYVRMVTSLIEGRQVSLMEILAMLERAVRQHSIGRRRRIDYILQYLNERAP